MLSDNEIHAIISAEERDAISYQESEISKKRTILMDHYNCQKFGDEVDGQSSFVTSDVADVIEWMIPSLIRIFTQGKYIATFEADNPEYDHEADQKKYYANWVFMRDNDGMLILHNMIKDALLQYTGTVKVYWDETTEASPENYRGLSELELKKLELDEELDIQSVEEEEVPDGLGGMVKVFHASCMRKKDVGRIRIDNIPPEEFLICRTARDFNKPRFIGHRTPKTRSELIEMGFDREDVDELPADNEDLASEKLARSFNLNGVGENNPTSDKSNDVIYLGEYYAQIDIDGDGISELWKIFVAGNEILKKEKVDCHPFAVLVPIPIPHRAIGTCPAEQVADIQYLKSTLVRQMLNNIYSTNFQRVLVNERIDLDDLLTPRNGGVIRVEGDGPIGDSAYPLVIPSVVGELLQAIEYVDTARETRTGVTRYNQGLDAESLNKTATGFRGMTDASQQRIELIARIFAETGIKQIFRLIVMLASKHQSDARQIRVVGEPMEINPSAWRHNLDCRIDVGLGAGDRQEKIVNLNQILNIQQALLAAGLPLVDPEKIFNTLDRLCVETGLKDGRQYFVDPTKPKEQLAQQVFMLQQQITQIQQQMNDPMIAIEQARSQGRVEVEQVKQDAETKRFLVEMEAKQVELANKQEEFNRNMLAKLTEMELKYLQNVPGALV